MTDEENKDRERGLKALENAIEKLREHSQCETLNFLVLTMECNVESCGMYTVVFGDARIIARGLDAVLKDQKVLNDAFLLEKLKGITGRVLNELKEEQAETEDQPAETAA